jgi:hypothetical protein
MSSAPAPLGSHRPDPTRGGPCRAHRANREGKGRSAALEESAGPESEVSEISDFSSWTLLHEIRDGQALTSLISPTTFEDLTGCLEALGGRHVVPGINHLPSSIDFPKAVESGIVPDLYVSGAFQAMWDDPTILPVLKPVLEISRSGSYQHWYGDRRHWAAGFSDLV